MFLFTEEVHQLAQEYYWINGLRSVMRYCDCVALAMADLKEDLSNKDYCYDQMFSRDSVIYATGNLNVEVGINSFSFSSIIEASLKLLETKIKKDTVYNETFSHLKDYFSNFFADILLTAIKRNINRSELVNKIIKSPVFMIGNKTLDDLLKIICVNSEDYKNEKY